MMLGVRRPHVSVCGPIAKQGSGGGHSRWQVAGQQEGGGFDEHCIARVSVGSGLVGQNSIRTNAFCVGACQCLTRA